jgi:hypothetical protein
MNSGLCSQIPREQTLPLERNPLGRSVKGSSEVIDHDATVRWQMGRAVLDLVWGFIAFVVVLAVSFLTREHQDIRSSLGRRVSLSAQQHCYAPTPGAGGCGSRSCWLPQAELCPSSL